VPRGFFEPGGIQIADEYHDGNEIAYYYSVNKLYEWQWDYDAFMLLPLKYTPVISVTTVEEETTPGTWTTRTAGSANDYIVVSDGVHFVANFPDPGYKNLRVTYLAGYALTPRIIQDTSAKMAALALQKILDTRDRLSASAGGVTFTPVPKSNIDYSSLTPSMKTDISQFVIRSPVAGGFVS
jgi:hypothetical protein